MVLEGKQCPIPVKFSYHQDGQIHFKPINPSKINMLLNHKIVEVQGTPFALLKGDHIFTIDVGGLDNFEDFKPTKQSELYRGFVVPSDAKRFKFVGYGGLSDRDIKGKFRACKIIKIERPSLPDPLAIGLHFRPFTEILDKENDAHCLLVLAGFRSEDFNIDRECKLLYLWAK